MQTVTLKIKDSAMDKVMSVLKGLPADELSIYMENDFSKKADTVDKNKQVDLSQFSISAFKQIKDPVAWQRQIRDEW